VRPDLPYGNEREFTRWALKQARSRGWLACHPSTYDVLRMRDGVSRAIPDRKAAGFPDLVLVHDEHGLVVAELKWFGRKPDEAQRRWLLALAGVGVRVFVWWPDDADEIVDVLEGRPPSRRLFDNTREAIA